MPTLPTLLASLLALGSPAPEKVASDDKRPAATAAAQAVVEAAPPAPATVAAPPSATVDVTDPAVGPGSVAARDDVSPAAKGADTGAPGVTKSGPAKKPLKTWLAVQSNIGLPDGLGVSAVFTPVEFLRLEFGAIGNGLNAGVRGGVTLLPKLWVVRPTLSVDGGRIFSGDASGIFGALLPEDVRPMLQGIAWNFASARLGMEVGTRRGAVQLQGGMSWIDVEVPGVAAVAQGLGSGPRFTGGAPHVQMWVPSVRVGLIVALF